MVDTECRADRRSILLRVETAEDERLAWLEAHASEQKLGIEGHQDAFHESNLPMRPMLLAHYLAPK